MAAKVTPILDLVVADLQERARVGLRKYGEPLRAFNGRSALQDAYEEALDLAMYLRQRLEEEHAAAALESEAKP